jgi:hypothetical protein
LRYFAAAIDFMGGTVFNKFDTLVMDNVAVIGVPRRGEFACATPPECEPPQS